VGPGVCKAVPRAPILWFVGDWVQRMNPLNAARFLGRSVAGNVGSLRYYMGDMQRRRDDFAQPGETVLLIQGFFQTRRVMTTLEHRLRADGFRVISFHLGGLLNNFNTQGVPTLARMIDGKIRRLLKREPFGPIHIIGHSKGGVIARYLVQQAGGADYTKTVITLGSPHKGTPVAAIGAGLGLLMVSRSLWQMFPRSPLVKSMNSRPFPGHVRLASVYSSGDIICPYTYSILTAGDGEDVRNILVRGLGHMALVEDPWVYGLILRELKGRPTDIASGPVAEESLGVS
jgi:triacylglycerol lipase